MSQNDNLQAVIDTATKAAMADKAGKVIDVGNSTFMLMPNEHNNGLKFHRMDEYMPTPASVERKPIMTTLDSFLEYFNRFAGAESTIYFEDPQDGAKMRCIGILDHDSSTVQQWERHCVGYQFPITNEWEDWKICSGRKMQQKEFAYFIEDHLDDIVTPDGAKMLEIAQTLQAKKNVDFRSGVRLDNGEVQFKYQEQIDGQAGVSGQLEIPSEIEIGLRLFAGGDAYKMKARFRYRITDDAKLLMWYDLMQPHRVIEDAADAAYKQIVAGITQGKVYRGCRR